MRAARQRARGDQDSSGSSGVDGEGVDPPRHQGVQGIIYEAMPGDRRQAFEARRWRCGR